MKTYALAALAAAAALTGVASAGAVTIAKEEASGTTDASLSVNVTVRRVKYTRFRVTPSASATVQTFLRLGFGGGETLTAEDTSPVVAQGSVSVTCDGPAGYDYNRWTYRQAAGSTASRTYRLPAAARGGKCQFSVSASADNPAGCCGTTGPYLPEPEYPTGSRTSTKGTETVVRVLVTSLR